MDLRADVYQDDWKIQMNIEKIKAKNVRSSADPRKTTNKATTKTRRHQPFFVSVSGKGGAARR